VRTEIANATGALRTEIANTTGALRNEMTNVIGGLRADMNKEFGSLRTSIEQARLGMLVTGVGAVILTTFATLGHVLKWF
jgi:hypothetical protein